MTIKISDAINKKYCIYLGRSGESNVKTHVFDMSEYARLYGDLEAELLFENPVGDVFPCVITQEYNNINWTITEVHTQYPGIAKARLIWKDSDHTKKSAEIICVIENGGKEVSGITPDPVKTWLAQVDSERFKYTEQGREIVADALRYADEASDSAESAGASAEAAAASVASIGTKAEEGVQAVAAKTAEGISRIESEKDGALAELEEKKQEVRNSIPPEYTALTEQVSQHSESIDEIQQNLKPVEFVEDEDGSILVKGSVIGINKTWELIDEYATDMDNRNYNISATQDGQPFSVFSKIMVEVTYPIKSEQYSAGNCSLSAIVGTVQRARIYRGGITIPANTQFYAFLNIELDNGMLRYDGDCNNESAHNLNNINFYGMKNRYIGNDKINTLYLGEFPLGTIVRIYGIRA